jgi:hypothetical protein
LVQPKQHPRGDGEVQRQVGGTDQAGQTRQSAGGVLHVRFLQEVEPALERYDFEGMVVGFARVAQTRPRASS